MLSSFGIWWRSDEYKTCIDVHQNLPLRPSIGFLILCKMFRAFDALAVGCWPAIAAIRDGTTRAKTLVVMSSKRDTNHSSRMNLNEYMVTLEKPLGIRFAVSRDGKIFVHSLKRGGNADRSRIVMVGDMLKKAGDSSREAGIVAIETITETEKLLNEINGTYSLILERPFTPFPIHVLHLSNDLDLSFNRGRVPIATWRKSLQSSSLDSSDGSGKPGFVTFSPKFLSHLGWNQLEEPLQISQSDSESDVSPLPLSPLVCILSEPHSGEGEWAHGNFPLEEYIKALERSKDELYYNHALGMHYKKITEHIYVGSCIQNEADVERLSNAGISAVINFQSEAEADNWGVNFSLINDSCERNNILMVNYPIRDGDSFDMRKKLPFCVALMLRLLKKNHRVFATCTTGFDRSPACVVAYLHWMTDTSLNTAYNFVTGLHACKPDRPAIAWATWDLVAMVEKGIHEGPATHAVTFIWNGHEGEEVYVVGDFTANWKEPLKAIHKGGSRFEAEVRLAHGKYFHKYIVNGQWRHSTSSPTERDEKGNVNNVIVVGDIASVRPSIEQHKKDANVVKAIERPLSENERFLLAKAARCLAFSVCPIKLAPKRM